MELAGRPLQALCEELGAAADALLHRLLAAGAGRSAREDGVLLWACRLRGERFGGAAAELAAQVFARRCADGTWPAQYAGAGISGALALARGLGSAHGVLAREIVLRCLATCMRRDYVGVADSGQPVAAGTRCLGEWAQLLAACGPLLAVSSERELRIAAARAVASILNCHHLPGAGLLVEVVDCNGFPFGDHRGSFAHSGAALDALRAVIEEAGRGSEGKLLQLGAEYLRQHIEAAWDEGIAEACVDEEWSEERPPPTQAAALSALAALVGYRAGAWEIEWFGRIYARFAAASEAEPVARLGGLVASAESLAGLVEREGRAPGWWGTQSSFAKGVQNE